MPKAEMVTALTTPAIDYRLVLQSEDLSVLDVPSGSYQIVKETGGRPVCQKKETAERLVDLLGDDMSCFNDVLTTASDFGSPRDDESLRALSICLRSRLRSRCCNDSFVNDGASRLESFLFAV